jgi:hypothetical protein
MATLPVICTIDEQCVMITYLWDEGVRGVKIYQSPLLWYSECFVAAQCEWTDMFKKD